MTTPIIFALMLAIVYIGVFIGYPGGCVWQAWKRLWQEMRR